MAAKSAAELIRVLWYGCLNMKDKTSPLIEQAIRQVEQEATARADALLLRVLASGGLPLMPGLRDDIKRVTYDMSRISHAVEQESGSGYYG